MANLTNECDVCHRMHTDKQYCPKRVAKFLILATYGINKLETPLKPDSKAIAYFIASYNVQDIIEEFLANEFQLAGVN